MTVLTSTCIVSIARLAVYAKHMNNPDKLWLAGGMELSVVEAEVGIIAACMPAFPAFFRNSKLFKADTYRSLRSRLFPYLSLPSGGSHDSLPGRSSSRAQEKTGTGHSAWLTRLLSKYHYTDNADATSSEKTQHSSSDMTVKKPMPLHTTVRAEAGSFIEEEPRDLATVQWDLGYPRILDGSQVDLERNAVIVSAQEESGDPEEGHIRKLMTYEVKH